jgi:Uma2 family endonuclease
MLLVTAERAVARTVRHVLRSTRTRPGHETMRMPATTHEPQRWTAQRVRDELLDDARPTPRYELIDGELLVTPSPDNPHQRAVRELFLLVHAYVERHGIGETLFSPSDIELAPDTIVQPDLYVMSSTSRLTRRWSADDRLLLAVEVLSPGSARHDRVKKRRFFARVGVPEYWVVDLDARVVERTRPDDDRIELLAATLDWQPGGAPEPLTLDLVTLFRRVLGDEAAS